MKNTSNLVWLLVMTTGALAVGCTGSRDVEVAGEVSAPSTVSVDGPITLDFFDVIAEGEEPKSVHTATLDSLGEFKETVELEGDTVRVRAINDRDGDGACTDGEAWGETDAAISDDDKVEAIKLELSNDPCPMAEES
jgi:hypothetical protein